MNCISLWVRTDGSRAPVPVFLFNTDVVIISNIKPVNILLADRTVSFIFSISVSKESTVTGMYVKACCFKKKSSNDSYVQC